MFDWILRYLGIDGPKTKIKRAARLSESEALSVARSAAEQSADAESLHCADIVEEQEEKIWVFATTSRGNPLVIKIRDRDGAVIGKERTGKR
jgi:hypothetical protein